ncbi:MAG: hypothetical protein ABII88_05740 [Candidatus Omnitrophota bacterium]
MSQKKAGFQRVFKNFFVICLINSVSLLSILPTYALVTDSDNRSSQTPTLSPRVNLDTAKIQGLFMRPMDFSAAGINYYMSIPEQMFTFSGQAVGTGLADELTLLNGQKPEDVIKHILQNPGLYDQIAPIILAQDRMTNNSGYHIDRRWAEVFKHEALRRAANRLRGRDIIFLQMEYELSAEFLQKFEKHLMEMYCCTQEEARYAVGQFAKLQMAGGLGSFKPDFVGGFFDDLKKFWGEIEARERLHVMGILYAKAIKGEGDLINDRRLDPVKEKIEIVRNEKAKAAIVKELTELINNHAIDGVVDDALGKLISNLRQILREGDGKIPEKLEALLEKSKNHSGNKNVEDVILQVKQIMSTYGRRAEGVHELVGAAIDSLEEIARYDVPVDAEGLDTVTVVMYKNPWSDLNEYWMYCPEVFQEAYPGNSDDHFRAVQTYVYRDVCMQHAAFLSEKKAIGDHVILSSSETSTALANPFIANPDSEKYGKNEGGMRRRILQMLARKVDLIHLYNHTIVPAGLNKPPANMFEVARIASKFGFVVRKENDKWVLDLRTLGGETVDLITGCSDAHTDICAEQDDLYARFSSQVKRDYLFGNSEGSDVERWQGEDIKRVINKYTTLLIRKGDLDVKVLQERISPYPELFLALDKPENKKLKARLIQELVQAKRIQKQRFIDELNKGTFFMDPKSELANIQGDMSITIDGKKVALIDRPFITFVRRMVEYKCSNDVLDAIGAPSADKDLSPEEYQKMLDGVLDNLEMQENRDKIKKSGAVFFIGGRKFSDFSEQQYLRIQELIKRDPEMKKHIIFISNHNIHTSHFIQQGTDFGGMLAWEGMEAGPTSPSNAGENFSAKFGVQDGDNKERLIPVEKDAKGKVIRGTGYHVKYGNEYAQEGQAQRRKPDHASFLEQLEAACNDYFTDNGRAYHMVAFNNLWLEMTQGDIRNQAAGEIMLFDAAIQRKQQEQLEIDTAIDAFVDSGPIELSKEQIKTILKGRKDVKAFKFNLGSKHEPKDSGLVAFLLAYKQNTNEAKLYVNGHDFTNYMQALLESMGNTQPLIDLLHKVAELPITPYQRQTKYIYIFGLLINRLAELEDTAPTAAELGVSVQKVAYQAVVEHSI